jgi:hypothetical protein
VCVGTIGWNGLFKRMVAVVKDRLKREPSLPITISGFCYREDHNEDVLVRVDMRNFDVSCMEAVRKVGDGNAEYLLEA